MTAYADPNNSHGILTVSNLKKRYLNGRGIEDVSFSIRRGKIFGLLGANGAGKTTTMKLITGEVFYDIRKFCWR